MNNEPAFPVVEYKQPAGGGAHVMTIVGGMTLRDYFAAKAMQGMVAKCLGSDVRDADLATAAYLIADAMLEARKK